MGSHDAGCKDDRRRFRRVSAVVALATIVSTVALDGARSQPGFPAKPIHILNPFGAGGVADVTMRLLAQKLTERTKQQVVIENRPGAGGLLAVRAVLEAPPDGYTLGVFGNGQAILDVAIIPYKTTPDLITAVLRGDVDVGFDYYAALQSVISDNRVRIVATSGEARNPLLPDVPTAKESGFPEYIVTSWNGLASAAGMPAGVLTVLNGHITTALSDPALQGSAAKLGMDARGSTPEEMRDRMATDIKRWAAVIEKSGIEKQ